MKDIFDEFILDDESLLNEIWTDVPGYNGYQVSNMGRVKSTARTVYSRGFGGCPFTVHEKILKVDIGNNGYRRVTFSIEGKTKRFLIHRLVAEAFIENTHNLPQVNHKKGIKADNRASQLEWVTHNDNEKHSYRFLKKQNAAWVTVLDSYTGIYYDSMEKAAIAKGIKPMGLRKMFYMNRKNNTGLIKLC